MNALFPEHWAQPRSTKLLACLIVGWIVTAGFLLAGACSIDVAETGTVSRAVEFAGPLMPALPGIVVFVVTIQL